MKDFYYVNEPYIKDDNDYKEAKRQKVLETIKPICEVFRIKDYDYILDERKERLVLEGIEIGCSCNSIGATVQELISYIFVKSGACKLKINNFYTQALNQICKYWY